MTLSRLRSLDVMGDYQLSFTADLAERDIEGCRGIVVVKCVELEALIYIIPQWTIVEQGAREVPCGCDRRSGDWHSDL